MSYKKTDDLMRYLRDSGISIQGSKQKCQLINTGYLRRLQTIIEELLILMLLR